MKQFLVIALAGVFVVSAHAVEYGSTTVAFEKNPEAKVEQIAQEICAKTGGKAKVTHQTLERIGYAYISCELNGKKTGDAMAKYAQGRADINYRLQ